MTLNIHTYFILFKKRGREGEGGGSLCKKNPTPLREEGRTVALRSRCSIYIVVPLAGVIILVAVIVLTVPSIRQKMFPNRERAFFKSKGSN